MYDDPVTKEEARLQRYGAPHREVAYDERQCAFRVWPAIGWGNHQCNRKPGHGPAQLYCRQHAEIVGRRYAEV